MNDHYNPAYAIPNAWLKGLIDHGDCPSDVHNAQYDLCYSIISQHPHLDVKSQSAWSYIASWAYMACTDDERLWLWPVLQDYEGRVSNLFEFADMEWGSALEHLREVCPKADEQLLEKLYLHLQVVREVSIYRDWIQIVRTEINEEDIEASLGERFLDANGAPFIKPRFPSGFYAVDPLFRSWYMPSPSKIAIKYESSGPTLDEDIEDNNNNNNDKNDEPGHLLTIKLDSTKGGLKAFVKFCTSLQEFELTTSKPFNHYEEGKATKLDYFGLCSIDPFDEYLFRVAPVPRPLSTRKPMSSNEAVKDAESLQSWEDLGVPPPQAKEGDWEFV